MAWIKPTPLASRRTPEACIKFFSRIRRDVPIRIVRLIRCSGMSDDSPEYGMKFFIGDIIIDRYEVKYQNGTYTIFDTWAR